MRLVDLSNKGARKISLSSIQFTAEAGATLMGLCLPSGVDFLMAV